jgi:hypothetical protein
MELVEIGDPYVAGYLIYKTFQPNINYRIFYELREYLRRKYNLSWHTTMMLSHGFYWTWLTESGKGSGEGEEFKRLLENRVEEYLKTEEGRNFQRILEDLKRLFDSSSALTETRDPYEEIARRVIKEELEKMENEKGLE